MPRFLKRLAVVAALVASSVAGLAQPSAALTANEKFVIAFYDDFLLRGPSGDEMNWWTTYLASGSRSAMATSLLNSDEFKGLWIMGVRSRYLDYVDAENPAFASDFSALQSSGDFVASEVAVLASAEYFSLHGSTNSDFVAALYEDVFLRAADPSGLAFWTARLDNATWTRSQVALAQIRTTEAANRRVDGTASATACASTTLLDEDSLASGSFCIVLDRLADPSGYSYWSGQLAGSAQLPALWVGLSSSTEHFNQAQLENLEKSSWRWTERMWLE